jgi:hypothetical protein
MVTLFMLYQMMKEFAEDERREQLYPVLPGRAAAVLVNTW